MREKKEREKEREERKREKKERERGGMRENDDDENCICDWIKKKKLNVPFHKSTSFQIVNTNTLVEISDVYTCVRVSCVDVGRSIRLIDR